MHATREASNIFMRWSYKEFYFKLIYRGMKKKTHNKYYLYKMFFIKYTLDSTRTDYTKNAAMTYCIKKNHSRIVDCTKKTTTKEIKTNIVAICEN